VGAAWDRIHASVRTRAPQARVQGLLIERMAPPGGVEVLVGVSRDPVFGPVLTFGLGGIHVELFQDVARRLLPLTRGEAERMVREPRSFALLDGARGRPKADVTALVDLLMAVSDFVAAQGYRIDEIDLNPVWVGPAGQGVMALDAVIVGRGEVPR
jgi:acyl-CoA synthetase (NDP forming)